MRMRKNLLETLDSIVKLLMLKSVLEETMKRLWETLGAPLPSPLNAYVPLGRVHSDHLLIFSFTYLLRHHCKCTMGILEQGCGREADKARGVAECLIRLRDHIRVQEFL